MTVITAGRPGSRLHRAGAGREARARRLAGLACQGGDAGGCPASRAGPTRPGWPRLSKAHDARRGRRRRSAPETFAGSPRVANGRTGRRRASGLGNHLDLASTHTHIVGWRLSSKLRLPWIADLETSGRRTPTERPTGCDESRIGWSRRLLLRRAAALVTVSPPLVRRLSEDPPTGRHPVHSTGFDPQTVAPADQPLSPRFNVVYTGRIYPGTSISPHCSVRCARHWTAEGSLPAPSMWISLWSDP